MISPVLANLFLHYAFDNWISKTYPNSKWSRYADDGVIHCNPKNEADEIFLSLKECMLTCKLEIHEEKSKIVYCKDSNRPEEFENTSFDFLGYTFRVRLVACRNGSMFVGFNPAVSKKASKSIQATIRSWKLQRMTRANLEEIAHKISPVIRGWINYYGVFHKSQIFDILQSINTAIVRWVKRKYKRFCRRSKLAYKWLAKVASYNPDFFPHWKVGIFPTT